MRMRASFQLPCTSRARLDASRPRRRRRFAPDAESLEIHVCLSRVGGLPAPSIPSPPALVKLPLASVAPAHSANVSYTPHQASATSAAEPPPVSTGTASFAMAQASDSAGSAGTGSDGSQNGGIIDQQNLQLDAMED